MRPILLTLVPVLLVACGGGNAKPDAGPEIDTSCGIDCAAQNAYGLILNRCFEYSAGDQAATTPDLGVVVESVVDLEGGVKGIRMLYRKAGAPLMEDTFLFTDGNLKLARRTDTVSSRSINYVNEAGVPVGVTLVESDSAANQSFSDNVTAVVTAGGSTEEATTFRGNTFAPTTSEKSAPLQTYENAVTFAYTETPDHSLDPRRVFVPDVGFIQLNTRVSLDPGATAAPYKLQNIRDLTTDTQTDCGS